MDALLLPQHEGEIETEGSAGRRRLSTSLGLLEVRLPEDQTGGCHLPSRGQRGLDENLLLESKQQIEDPNFISLVHRSVGSARKKRKLLSRKKQEWRKFKEKMPDFRREKHKRIDLWLERMQDQVERAQRYCFTF
ncbi:unnamed protein product [Nesidiocoris tenuis]|uniref:Uncharacterized protein n=1 Tax=Nesidiocoris tenuis TaxID=355587 RepID=A0A6H5GZD7_9HEMI|nr:unnamed protein product [Nesidiocoris tenuis]